MGRDRDRDRAGIFKQCRQFVPISEDKWRTQSIGRAPPGNAFQQRHFRGVGRIACERVPDCHRQAAAGSQQTQHLAERSVAIREEHEAKLTHNRIESSIGERQRLGNSLPPLDRWREFPGHRQHSRQGIHPDNLSGGSCPRGGFSREHSGATGDVQHPLTAFDLCGVCDSRGPLPEQRGHEEGFVRFRGIDLGLRRRFAHVAFLPARSYLWVERDDGAVPSARVSLAP